MRKFATTAIVLTMLGTAFSASAQVCPTFDVSTGTSCNTGQTFCGGNCVSSEPVCSPGGSASCTVPQKALDCSSCTWQCTGGKIDCSATNGNCQSTNTGCAATFQQSVCNSTGGATTQSCGACLGGYLDCNAGAPYDCRSQTNPACLAPQVWDPCTSTCNNPAYLSPASPQSGNISILGNITTTGGMMYTVNGSAGIPAYSFAGDTNTGMFNATGVDVLGFSTAGTERLRIGATGNVGVGTNNPTALLSVGTSFRVTNAGAISASTGITNTGMTLLGSGSLALAGTQNLIYGLVASGVPTTTSFILMEKPAGTPLFRVDTAGNLVRINNVAYSWPAAQGAASTVLTNDGSGTLSWVASAGGVGGSGTTNYLSKFTAASTLGNSLVFDNGTNVGIGDTTPAALFTVGNLDTFQVNSSGNLVRINNVAYSWPAAQGAMNTVLQNNGIGTLSWVPGLPGAISGQTLRHDGANWIANSVLTNDGTNVGIGMSGPAFRLDVNGTANVRGMTTLGDPSLALSGTQNLLYGNVGSAPLGTNLLLLQVAAATKFRVDNNGNLQIPTGAAAGRVLTATDALGNAAWQAPAAGVGGSGTTNYVPKFTAASTLGNSLIYDEGTRIGIGTAAPSASYKLHVYDNSGAAAAMGITSTGPSSGVIAGATGGASIGLTAFSNVAANIFTQPAAYSAQVFANNGASKMFIGPYSSVPLIFGVNYGSGLQRSSLEIAANGDAVFGSYYKTHIASQAGGYLFYADPAQQRIGINHPGAAQALNATLEIASSFGSESVRITPNNAPAINVRNNIGTELFKVDVNGNIIRLNSVTYSWPSLQGAASTVLTNNGSGTLTWAAAGGGVGGSGTTNYLPKFTAASTLGNSLIFDNGTYVGIGTASPGVLLDLLEPAGLTALRVQTGGTLLSGASAVSAGGLAVGSGARSDSSNMIVLGQNSGNPGDAFSAGAVLVGPNVRASGSANAVVIGSGVDNGSKLVASAKPDSVMIGAHSNVPSIFIEPGALATPGRIGIGTLFPTDLFSVGSSGQFRVNNSGLVSAPNGTAAAPAYTFVASTNAGLFHTGGELGVSTAGVERVRFSFGGNVGIGDTTPGSLLTVGNGDLFQVSAIGDLVRIRNVTYSWPAAQGGASTVLTNNGSGTLSWAAAGGGCCWSLASGNATMTGGVLATGTVGSGTIPATGAGARMMWYPGKAAFRAGDVNGTQWDDAQIGYYTAVFGRNNTALGGGAFAAGFDNSVPGDYSAAFGIANFVNVNHSFAAGGSNTVNDQFAAAIGGGNTIGSTSDYSVALGRQNITNAPYTVVGGWGNQINVGGDDSAVFGLFNTTNRGENLIGGYYNDSTGYANAVFGGENTVGGGWALVGGSRNTLANALNATILGQDNVINGGDWATTIGADNVINGSGSVAIGVSTNIGANYAVTIGHGPVFGSSRLSNTIQDSLMVGFNSTIPTLFVGPSAGAGTTGNVGIGTAAPSEKLHVAGGDVLVDSTATPEIRLVSDNSSSPSWRARYYLDRGATSRAGGLWIAASQNATAWFVGAPYFAGSATTDFVIGYNATAPEDRNNFRMLLTSGGVPRFSGLLSCGGVMTNASGVMSCTSDGTLKDVHGSFAPGMEAIDRLNPVVYSWKQGTDLYDGGSLNYGFIAQDVQKVLPEAVTVGADGKLQLGTTTILAASVNALKELHGRLTILEDGSMKELDGRVTELEDRVDRLERELLELQMRQQQVQ